MRAWTRAYWFPTTRWSLWDGFDLVRGGVFVVSAVRLETGIRTRLIMRSAGWQRSRQIVLGISFLCGPAFASSPSASSDSSSSATSELLSDADVKTIVAEPASFFFCSLDQRTSD